MTVTRSLSIPRLPGVHSPGIRECLLSGAIWWDAKGNPKALTFENVTRGSDPGKGGLGVMQALPTVKGLVCLPRLSLEELALRGDPVAALKVMVNLGLELAPIPGGLDAILQIGDLIGEVLEIDTDVLPDPPSSNYFQRILRDKKTFATAYVDLVEARLLRGEKGFWGMHLVTEDTAGRRQEIWLRSFSDLDLDVFFALRWRQEFDWLLVKIIEEVIGGGAFWQDVRKELQRHGVYSLAAPVSQVTLRDLVRDDLPLRFYLGADVDAWDAVGDMLAARLEGAGFEQAEALTLTYLVEDTAGRRCTVKDGRDAWVVACTDRKLASRMLEHMQPNLEAQRAMLRENTVNRAEYTLSYVEMLERGARGEPLGRVNRLRPSPFY